MAVSSKYAAELKKGANTPNTVIEIALDGGTVRYGFLPYRSVDIYADGSYYADDTVDAGGTIDAPSVLPILKSVSSLQNKLDPKAGFSTRGQLTVVLGGREHVRGLIENEYLKNRRVFRKDGFMAEGFSCLEYAATFTGKVQDWSLRGDELTLVVADDLKDASVKIPVENAAKTQYIDYRNTNPVDIMTDILQNRVGISGEYIDTALFSSERDLWLNGWRFDRVLTEPREANEYLNDLQIETNSFIVHDGQKINYKVFAPPAPGQSVEEWTDSNNIIEGTFSAKSGYKDGFFNRVVIYFDYDESGGDKEENFESAVIAADAASQGSAQWDEVKTKVIKSKWIRSRTYTAASITGVTLYHVSQANGTGSGTLTYNRAANTLQWAAPGGAAGEAVKLSASGRYRVFDSDRTKYVRVIADTSALPLSNATDTITIEHLNGAYQAETLASKLLNRYRDPAALVSFEIDINNCAYNSGFIKPGDLKDVTTAEAYKKGGGQWSKQRVMLTSVRPDFSTHRVSIEAIETGLYRRYGFIAPLNKPDYPAASGTDRQYGFIGGAENRVNAGSEDGFYIW